jgi:glutathione peroxidase
MKRIKLILAVLIIASGASFAQKNIYDFKVKNIKSEQVDLNQYEGKVVLIVNTASKCGLTPQYEGLEALYRQYSDRGFVILGFPCNQFLGQEPGTADEIQSFCTTEFDISFPLFEKVNVNGRNAHHLYKYLKTMLPLKGNDKIRWNFEKFLINKEGVPVKRYAPSTKPESLKSDIENLLK